MFKSKDAQINKFNLLTPMSVFLLSFSILSSGFSQDDFQGPVFALELARDITKKSIDKGEQQLKERLQEHLSLIKSMQVEDPNYLFDKRVKAEPKEVKQLEKTLGSLSEGIVLRQSQIQNGKKLELSYGLKINRDQDKGHIGPFPYQGLKTIKKSNHSTNDSKIDKQYKNFTIELGNVFIDLYEIDHTEYLIGNVYVKNEYGVIEFFGQTIIQKTRG